MDKRAALERWMEENERGPAWVAKKVGYTREWISNVLHGHKPFSDKLARELTEHLGIQFETDAKSESLKRSHKSTKSEVS